MNKQALIPSIVITAAVVLIFAVAAVSDEWQYDYDTDPESIDFTDGSDASSINHVLFEDYGPMLLILGLLMFGAVIGGVYIAKEDDEDDSD